MQSKLPMLLVTLLALITPAVAQTYGLAFQPPSTSFMCGPSTSCDGMQFYPLGANGLPDTTQPPSSVWFDVDAVVSYTNGIPNPDFGNGFLCFTAGPLSSNGCNDRLVQKFTVVQFATFTSNGRTAVEPSMISATATLPDGSTAIIALTYTHFYTSGGGGRGGGGAGWKTQATSGALQIGTASPNASHRPLPESPIAPTPTCLPTATQPCPIHDL